MKKQSKSKAEPISGYKGFDKDLKCRDKQYTLGEEVREPTAKICNSGIHFCLNPLDVLSCYPPINGNRYAEVKSYGEIDAKTDEDSKMCSTRVKIGVELNIKSMIEGAVKFVFEKVKASKDTSATTGCRAHSATTGYGAHSATTGCRAHSATTGYGAHSATTGECANSATTGECAHSATTGNGAHSATTGECANSATTGYGANSAAMGKNSVAAGIGINNKAKAALGNWIVLAEWKKNNAGEWFPADVKSAKIDGKKLLPDQYYQLVNGIFEATT